MPVWSSPDAVKLLHLEYKEAKEEKDKFEVSDN
jgi:hypothetical protein